MQSVGELTTINKQEDIANTIAIIYTQLATDHIHNFICLTHRQG